GQPSAAAALMAIAKPDAPDPWRRLARAQRAAGDLAGAAASCGLAAEGSTGRARAGLLLEAAELYRSVGARDRAAAALARAAARSRGDPDVASAARGARRRGPADLLAFGRLLATETGAGAVDEDGARTLLELAAALGAPLSAEDKRYLVAHPARTLAPDEPYD